MAPKKDAEKKVDADAPPTLAKMGPMRSGEDDEVFAVAHIYASFNDTFLHVTDPSGRETICRVTGGELLRLLRYDVI